MPPGAKYPHHPIKPATKPYSGLYTSSQHTTVFLESPLLHSRFGAHRQAYTLSAYKMAEIPAFSSIFGEIQP